MDEDLRRLARDRAENPLSLDGRRYGRAVARAALVRPLCEELLERALLPEPGVETRCCGATLEEFGAVLGTARGPALPLVCRACGGLGSRLVDDDALEAPCSRRRHARATWGRCFCCRGEGRVERLCREEPL